jgi:hypothetical protein
MLRDSPEKVTNIINRQISEICPLGRNLAEFEGARAIEVSHPGISDVDKRHLGLSK